MKIVNGKVGVANVFAKFHGISHYRMILFFAALSFIPGGMNILHGFPIINRLIWSIIFTSLSEERCNSATILRF